ncbi:MAG: tRNA pseudouridine(55) synthase TruB [Pseudomonadota bacterium]
MTSGILLLDKPQGLSSNAALQRVRHAFGKVKAGHTGSLDPLATGMLPICLGEATKVAGDLIEGRKAYVFDLRLGERTATGDREGEVVERLDVPVNAAELLREAAVAHSGAGRQIPPMYSALKRDGQPLYKLARQGIEVPRESRAIQIDSLVLVLSHGVDSSWRVICSKGTYVRTLAEDIARSIGCCGHLVRLRREWVEPFAGLALQTLDAVLTDPMAATLLPADAALPQLAAVSLDEDAVLRLQRGQQQGLDAAQLAGAPEGRVRVYARGGVFLGVGEIMAGGVLQPRRLFNDLRSGFT